MPDSSSKRLSQSDRELLSGFPGINKYEPEQLYDEAVSSAPEPAVKKTSARLKEYFNEAEEILQKIKELKEAVDNRCKNFSVSSGEKKGSRLFQAMVRVFSERTTTVTYKHYKRALELRKQLAAEGTERLKKE